MTKSPIPASHQSAIYQVIAQIPAGKVATYGQVATLAGISGAARYVGGVLRKLPNNTQLPWHRVINAQGRLSLGEETASGRVQKQRLQQEGIIFSNKKIRLKEFGWNNAKG